MKTFQCVEKAADFDCSNPRSIKTKKQGRSWQGGALKRKGVIQQREQARRN